MPGLLKSVVSRWTRIFRPSCPVGFDFERTAGQTVVVVGSDCQSTVGENVGADVTTLPVDAGDFAEPSIIDDGATGAGAITVSDVSAWVNSDRDDDGVAAVVKAIAAAMAGELEPLVLADANPVRRFKLALRLRLVAKIQALKKGRVAKPVGKARANLKPKPVVTVGRAAKKRGPEPFASKVKRPVAKRASVKIRIEKRAKPTAQILAFPVRKPHSVVPRLKRAA